MTDTITLSITLDTKQLARLTRIPAHIIKDREEQINDYFVEFFLNEDNTQLLMTEHVDLLTQAVLETCGDFKEGAIESLMMLTKRHPPEIVSKFKTLWKTELTNRNDWLKPDGTYNYKILDKIQTALLQQAYQEEYTTPSSV